eukprot:NODE_27_length_39007_cov_1.590650.p10 type:complete len:427 gc:universal NODE_27_length_39007_cov_1.590650:36732-35452(-)
MEKSKLPIVVTNKLFFQTFMRRVLTRDSIHNCIKNAEYAVRGELAIKAESLLSKGRTIIQCNIGNPQSLNQKPITFLRQVSALVDYPELIGLDKFPSDVKKRAEDILSACKSVGAYSHSKGIPYIRKNVAKFIESRDGYPSDYESIFLTDGASPAVQMILKCLIQNEKVGIMIPIPQYPLYSASITLNGGQIVRYEMDEEDGWDANLDKIIESLKSSRKNGIDVRALCVINPGNPIGNVLSLESMREIVKLCYEQRLVLLADEVYQTNVYLEKPWYSFKKVVMDMGSPYSTDLELFSFHSTSKGVVGECGRRGGYVEAVNIDPQVLDELYKLASVNLCSNTMGQIGVDLMVSPPTPGSPSYDLYASEVQDIFGNIVSFRILEKAISEISYFFKQASWSQVQPSGGCDVRFCQIRISRKIYQRGATN